MIVKEPRWKSYIVETTTPIFTPEQCKLIIAAGQSEPKQELHILVGYLLKRCLKCINRLNK